MKKLSLGNSEQTGFDLKLLFITVLLVIFGLVMVYDASVIQAFKDYGDNYAYIRQQLIWTVLGFGALFFFSAFNYQHLRIIALPFLIFSLILLVAVLIPGIGVAAGGAHRWLRIGPFTVQPAEIIKLSSIIFFAALFEKRVKTAPFLIVTFLVSFIIGVLQRDLGSTIVYFLTAVTVYIFAGAPVKMFLPLIPVSIIGFLAFVLTSTYRKNRVLAFLDPFADLNSVNCISSPLLICRYHFL